MRAKQILRLVRESVWSNSNTDAAAVDLSIFYSPLEGCFTIYSFFVFFLIDHQDGGRFKLRNRHSPPPCYRSAEMFKTLPFFFHLKAFKFHFAKKKYSKNNEKRKSRSLGFRKYILYWVNFRRFFVCYPQRVC